MKKIGIIVGLLGTLLLPQSGKAQGAPSSWSEKQQRVNALILMRLTQELNLNASQSGQLGQILKKYQERRHALKTQLRGLNTQLRAATTSGNEAEIKKLVSQRNQIKADLDQIDDQTFADVKPMLNTRQQAQFLLVMDEIRSEIRAVHRKEGAAGFPGTFSTDPNTFPGAVNPNDPNAINRAIQP